MIKEKIDYPTQDEEFEILNRIERDVFSNTQSVVELEDLYFLQQMAKKIYLDDAIKRYIISIVNATRHAEQVIGKELAEYITLGSSTRGCIALMEVSKAVALINGRSYVTPDDVKTLIHSVLRHRISLNFAAVADGVTEEQIIDKIVGAIATP